MGHERIGALPRTRCWRNIVEQIGVSGGASADTAEIAANTVNNVRDRLDNMHLDAGVKAAFEFLVLLSVSARSDDPGGELAVAGIMLPAKVTPLTLAIELSKWISERRDSLEYAQIAQQAAADAIGGWYDQQNSSAQQRLFEISDDRFDAWRVATTGRGFCGVARLFFAHLTERYLNYFLEREASSQLSSIEQRDQFNRGIRQHSYETAKITQSFAAGWFNTHAANGAPSEQSVEAFLRLAFQKIRDELRREGAGLQ
jgi:hypothetical protein